MSPTPLDDPYRLLRDLRALLDLHREFGLEGYPRSPELTRFLTTPPAVARRAAATPSQPPSQPPPSAEPTPAPAPAQVQDQTPKQAASRTLSEIREAMAGSCRCPGTPTPRRLVFGCGAPKASLFIVGDLPAPEDEVTGTPFSDAAGELLTKMLKAIGLGRDEVYLTTLVKCRPLAPGLPLQPPGGQGKAPSPDLVTACLPLLIAQIEAVAPKVICTMGQLTAQTLLHTTTPLIRLRGRFHEWHHLPLMPTFHPGFLLKNPEMKRAAWADLQLIQAKLGLGVSH